MVKKSNIQTASTGLYWAVRDIRIKIGSLVGSVFTVVVIIDGSECR